MAPPPRLLWSGGIFLAVKNSLEGPEWPGRPGPDTRIPGYGQGTNSGLSSAPAQGPGHKNFPLLETNDPEMFQSIQDWLGKKTNWEINIAYFDTSTFIYKALFLSTSLSLKHSSHYQTSPLQVGLLYYQHAYVFCPSWGWSVVLIMKKWLQNMKCTLGPNISNKTNVTAPRHLSPLVAGLPGRPFCSITEDCLLEML